MKNLFKRKPKSEPPKNRIVDENVHPIIFIKSLFKRKPKSEPPKKEPNFLEKKAKESMKDSLSWVKPPINRDSIIKSMFPRTVDKVKSVRTTTLGAVAMDSANKPQEMAVALDASFQGTTLLSSQIPDKILEFFGNHSFIGWQACAILRQNYLINAACTIPAEDAMAPDFKLGYADNNDKKDEPEDQENKAVDEQKLIDIKQAACDEYGIGALCRQLTINKKTFGIGLAIPVMKDSVDMSLPFNLDGIKKGEFKGWTLVEPYWAAPNLDQDAAGNPSSKYFYEPTWWNIGGKLVHRSWCIKVLNTSVPDILKPTYYYGGIPLPQMIYERVYAADKVANEAPLLAMQKRLLYADADIENLIADPDTANTIMEALSWYRSNHGVMFKRPGDEIGQIDTALADFDSLIMTQYQLVATIANMPATKLLKTTPKGFNATGEYEWKDYAQSLVAIQEHDFKPLLNRHFELYTKSEFGKEIPMVVTFNPVDVPSEKDVAEVEEIYSRVLTNLSNSGVISNEEVRDIIRNKEGSMFSTLEEQSDEDLEANAEADKLAGELEKDSDTETE